MIELALLEEPVKQEEREQVLKTIKKARKLLSQFKIGKIVEYETDSIMEEMKKILGIQKEDSNSNAVISLYNYMSLVFSQVEEIDYQRLKTNMLSFDFKNQTEGSGLAYSLVIASINSNCNSFNETMKDKKRQNENPKRM